MKVKDVAQREVAVCYATDTLEAAARVMWDNDCGCVPVVDGENRPIGMITDRDLSMTAYLRGCSLRDVALQDVMAREVQTCRSKDRLEVPHRLMREHQLHRLPVVDEHGALAGVLSLSDIARSVERESDDKRRCELADELVTTLIAVTRPREQPGEEVLVPKGADEDARATTRSGSSGARAHALKG